LESAEACLSEFETISSSDPQDTFVRRLNEFLVSARRISEFLPKETGRATGLETWMEQEHDNLLSDPRYAYFGALRNISTHDCIVRPDIAEAELRDAKTGRVTGHVTYDSPVGAESVHEEVRAQTKYFFADRQSEDIATFCREILNTLGSLVSEAYHYFP
jgi:hypothetical protein